MLQEKRPRHYAEEIVVLKTKEERDLAMDRVPEAMRGTVRAHVEHALMVAPTFAMLIEEKARAIARIHDDTRRENAIEAVRKNLREDVRTRVKELTARTGATAICTR